MSFFDVQDTRIKGRTLNMDVLSPYHETWPVYSSRSSSACGCLL